MNREQVEVVELLVDIIIKLVLAGVAALILIACTVQLIRDPSWPIAIVEVVFGATVGVVYKHYFPARSPHSPRCERHRAG